MPKPRTNSWQDIRDRIRNNIQNRLWLPGQLIPGEAALAEEFGCARTTVNRALRELANTGVIDRKRKAGTRVAMQKTRRVSADIPIIRTQVEAQSHSYSVDVIERKIRVPPMRVRAAMQLADKSKSLHVKTLHKAGGKPFVYEERWVNTDTVPEILDVDFQLTSANEWLVHHVPFTSGGFTVEAVSVGVDVAKIMKLTTTDTILKSQRDTWIDNESVTLVCLYYLPGHQLKFQI